METSEVLNRAADLIEDRGWMKGAGWVVPSTPDGAPVCLEGAIQVASGIPLRTTDGLIRNESLTVLHGCPAYRAVSRYLELGKHPLLFRWNDYGVRTAAEVVEVLRACAVIEQSRERQPVEVAS